MNVPWVTTTASRVVVELVDDATASLDGGCERLYSRF